MRQDMFSKIRSMPWIKLGQAFEGFGWEMDRNRPTLKRFVRGDERISVIRVARGKWKVLYLEKGKMVDFAGIEDEYFAKITAGELLLLKSITTYWSSS